MSRKALEPVVYLISESTKREIGKTLDELPGHDKTLLESYLLQNLSIVYRPAGKMPKLGYENEDCEDLRRMLLEKEKDDVSRLIYFLVKTYFDNIKEDRQWDAERIKFLKRKKGEIYAIC